MDRPEFYVLYDGSFAVKIEDYAKKGSFGGYRSAEKEDAIFAVIDKDELDRLWNNRKDVIRTGNAYMYLVEEKDKEIKDLNEKIDNYRQHGKEMIQQIKDKDKEIGAIKKQLQEKDKEVEKANSLNRNLLRVCRENANQKRNIRPKKHRSGYRFVSLEQYEERMTFTIKGWRGEEQNTVRFKAWKTVFESPYSCFLSQEQIKELIYEDLTEKGVLYAMNIPVYGKLKMEEAETPEKYPNKMFETKYKANGRSGFWEVTIFHTLPATICADFLTNNEDQGD